MSEFNLIRQLLASGPSARRDDVELGPGDDAAIVRIPADTRLATTTDTLIAGRHFPINTAAEAVGHKALAVNLSDLAAMGAEPAWASLALTLPEADDDWLQGFARGFSALAREHGVALIGGDTTRGPLSLSLTLTGYLPAHKSLLRSTAEPNEDVYVSGYLGAAAEELQRVLNQPDTPAEWRHHLDFPQPRVALGQQLVDMASSSMDISDGLIADAQHLASASQLAIDIDLSAVPLAPALQGLPKLEAWSLAAAGDDYELLFTAPKALREDLDRLSRELALPLTKVGRTHRGDGVHLFESSAVPFRGQLRGYDHFSA